MNNRSRGAVPAFDPGSDKARPRRPARAVSAANQIVAEVRDALLEGDLESGDFLGTEASLAEHFGVGRSPIRDALRSLEAMGVIEIRAGLHGGVYVAQGNPKLFAEALGIQLQLIGITLSELFDAIWAVEGMAVGLAIDNATEEDLQQIRGIVEDLSHLTGDRNNFSHRSLDFHAAVVEASHSRALVVQAEMLREILFRHYSAVASEDVAARVLDSLGKLAHHLSARDREAARAQLDWHYQQARADMVAGD